MINEETTIFVIDDPGDSSAEIPSFYHEIDLGFDLDDDALIEEWKEWLKYAYDTPGVFTKKEYEELAKDYFDKLAEEMEQFSPEDLGEGC